MKKKILTNYGVFRYNYYMIKCSNMCRLITSRTSSKSISFVGDGKLVQFYNNFSGQNDRSFSLSGSENASNSLTIIFLLDLTNYD